MKKAKKAKKIYYYSDELNDDFAKLNINQKKIDEKFRYINKNPLFRFFAYLLTYFVARPILYFVIKIKYRMKIVNKKVLRSVKHTSYFLYGNHTQYLDAAIPQVMINKRKKTYLIANPDATSIVGLKAITKMLGALPLPSSYLASKNFINALNYRLKQNSCIAIYPEAHIWPYYTKIRPFKNDSFRYPVTTNKPVIAMCVTYQQTRFIKRPKLIIYLSEVFLPRIDLFYLDAKEDLRTRVFTFMDETARKHSNYEHYQYIKK